MTKSILRLDLQQQTAARVAAWLSLLHVAWVVRVSIICQHVSAWPWWPKEPHAGCDRCCTCHEEAGLDHENADVSGLRCVVCCTPCADVYWPVVAINSVVPTKAFTVLNLQHLILTSNQIGQLPVRRSCVCRVSRLPH